MSLNHLLNNKELSIQVKRVDTDTMDIDGLLTADELDIENLQVANVNCTNDLVVGGDLKPTTTKSTEYGNEGTGQKNDTSQYNYLVRQDTSYPDPLSAPVYLLKGGSTIANSAGYPYVRTMCYSTGKIYHITGSITLRTSAPEIDYANPFTLVINFKMKPRVRNTDEQGDIPEIIGARGSVGGGATGFIECKKTTPALIGDALGVMYSDYAIDTALTHEGGNNYRITDVLIPKYVNIKTDEGWEQIRVNFNYAIEVKSGLEVLL